MENQDPKSGPGKQSDDQSNSQSQKPESGDSSVPSSGESGKSGEQEKKKKGGKKRAHLGQPSPAPEGALESGSHPALNSGSNPALPGASVPAQMNQSHAAQGPGQISPGHGTPVWVEPYGWVMMPYQERSGQSNPNLPVISPAPPGAPPPPSGQALSTPAPTEQATSPASKSPSEPAGSKPAKGKRKKKIAKEESAREAAPPDEMASVQTDESLPIFEDGAPQEDEVEAGADTDYASDADGVEEGDSDKTTKSAAGDKLDDQMEAPQDSTRITISEKDRPPSQSGPYIQEGTAAANDVPQDSTRASIPQDSQPRAAMPQSSGSIKPFISTGNEEDEIPQDSTRNVAPGAGSTRIPSTYVQPAKSTFGQEARDEDRGAWGRHVFTDPDKDEEVFEERTPTDPLTTASLPAIPDPTGAGPTLPPQRPRHKRSLFKTIGIATLGTIIVTCAIGAVTFPWWKDSLEAAGVDFDNGLVGLSRLAKPEEERLLLAAQDAANNGEDWETIELSTLVLDKYPENSEAYYLRGKAEMQLRTYDKAVKDLTEVKRYAPANIKARLLLARSLVEVGESVSAIEECDLIEGMQKTPQEERLFLHVKGLAKLKVGDYPAAVQFFEKASKLPPDSTEICSDYAQCLFKTGVLQDAETQALKAISLNSKNAEAYHILGEVKLAQKNPTQALKYFDQARTLRTQDVDYCIDWAELAAEHGKHTDALDALGDIEQSHPRDQRLKRVIVRIAEQLLKKAAPIAADPSRKVEAWTDMAYALRKLKKLDQALILIGGAVDKDKNYARAYLYRAQIYSQMKGQSQQAIDSASIAVAKDSKLINAYFTRAFAYSEQKKWNDAIEDYKKYIRARTTPSADAEHNLGLCYHMLGNYKEALKHYTRAIEINPSDPTIYTVRADAFKQLGQLDDALQDLKAAIIYDASYPKAYRARAEVWAMLEDYDRSADDYRKYVSLERNNPEALLATAGALLKAGKANDAMGYCQHAMDNAKQWGAPYLKKAECLVALNEDRRALKAVEDGLGKSQRGYLINKKAEIYLLLHEYSNAANFAVEAQKSSPDWNGPSAVLAVAAVYEGKPQLALSSIAQYSDRSETLADDCYSAIWEFFVRAKTGTITDARGNLKNELNKIDYTAWPMPLAKFLASDLSKDDMLRSARGETRLTEAHAFAGVLAMLQKETTEANKEFEWVKQRGDRNTLAYAAAMAEMRKH